MDVFAFDTAPPTDAPRTKPFDASSRPTPIRRSASCSTRTSATSRRTQRGLHQPGFTHLTVSPTEECRIVNLHRTLEEHLGIGPEDG